MAWYGMTWNDTLHGLPHTSTHTGTLHGLPPWPRVYAAPPVGGGTPELPPIKGRVSTDAAPQAASDTGWHMGWHMGASASDTRWH